MGGYEVKSDKVRTLVYACLCGNAAKAVLKQVGVQLGNKLSEQAVKNISATVLTKINETVGFRLITKFGEKGVINLGQAIPIVGGLIGGTIDAVSTNTIGNVARNIFISGNGKKESVQTFAEAS